MMLDTIAFLTENCCADHPEDCTALRCNAPEASAFLPPLDLDRKCQTP
jgi:hypothetical protein